MSVTDAIDSAIKRLPVARDIGWPAPQPLDSPAVPRFPVDALPEPYRSFVTAEAAATQTPPDMAGMFTLAALATVCAGHAYVAPSTSWSEPMCLFVAVAMEPGSRKSAVHRDVTGPIRQYELELVEEQRPLVADAASRRRIAEQRQAKAEKRAADAAGPEARDLEMEARALARELDSIPPPELPRLFTSDATPEAIASLMAANRGVLSVLSAESGVFGIMAGRYSAGIPNLDVFLAGHAGDPIRIDRRGRAPEHIDAPALTIGLAVQPYVLRRVATVAEFTGRGLLDRFLYVLPSGNVGYRDPDAEPLSPSIRAAYEGAMIGLAREMRQLAAPLTLTLERDGAAALFGLWRADMEPRRRPDADLGRLAGWSSKLDGAAARIAGLLHLAEHGASGVIGPATMNSALLLADYLVEHALAVHDLMGVSPVIEDSRRVIRWIRAGGREQFTRRDLHRAMEQRFSGKPEALDACLALLTETDHLRSMPVEHSATGRPPSPAFEVHPHVNADVPTQQTKAHRVGGSVSSVGTTPQWSHP